MIALLAAVLLLTPRLTRIAVMLHTDLAMRLFEGDSGSADAQWHLGMVEQLLRFP